MKDLLWNLFVKTGKIEYYLRYKGFDTDESRDRKEI